MKRASLISVLSILTLVAFLPAAAQDEAERVAWVLYGGDPEAPADGVVDVPCGSYGRFAVAKEELPWADRTARAVHTARFGRAKGGPGCSHPKAMACGSEIPPLYPSPPLPKEIDLAATGTKAEVPWIPCEDGQCFEDEIPVGSPWVAVIDWDNLHGWSIGWTISHLSGAPVVLFPLYGEPLGPFSRLGATDLHVLVRLCEVAEIADQGNPPLVINMSFGRLYRKDDPATAASCKSSTLSCQIARVLHHLACKDGSCAGEERPSHPRTLPVVAAGNFRLQQFPAALPAAVAAGSLQIGRFRADRQVEASWETPKYERQASMPGYGLCLGETGEEWPAPPGTSYAAAVFSGWLASLPWPEVVADPLSEGTWFPSLEGEHFYLAHGDDRYLAGPTVKELLERNLTAPSRSCAGSATGSAAPYLLQLAEPSSSLVGLPSFLEVLDKLAHDLKRPAPTDRPCVPCIGIETASPPDRMRKDVSSTLTIDRQGSLEATGPSNPPDFGAGQELVVQDLYLRRGTRFRRLKAEREEGLPFLSQVRSFAIADVDVPAGEQPSLVYVYQFGGIRFWSSVPVLVNR